MKLGKLLLSAIPIFVMTSALADFEEGAAFIDESAGKCAVKNDMGDRITTMNSRIVATRNADLGTVHLKCTFDGEPTFSGKAWTNHGFMCGTYLPGMGMLMTLDTHVKQTPKGKMTLTCHF